MFFPSLEMIAQHSEKQLGRPLNEDELVALKEKSMVIALPPAVVKEMKRNQ
jgi:hypothetical protein